MSRDQQADGAHGYGICVKGGKETGKFKLISKACLMFNPKLF